MDVLRRVIGGIVSEAEAGDDDLVVVPMVAVDLLISRFARRGGRMRLHRAYEDLSHLTRRARGNTHVVAAFYDDETQTMFIGTGRVPFANAIESILHEIQHFNQHVGWLTDAAFRRDFVGDFDLPKGTDASNLDGLRFQDLIRFWRRRYGYNEAPQELDAVIFAQQHLDAALDAIIDEFKHLDDDPGDPWGEKTEPDVE